MNLVVVVAFLLNGHVGQVDVRVFYVTYIRRVPEQELTLISFVFKYTANALDATESTEAGVKIIHPQRPKAGDKDVSVASVRLEAAGRRRRFTKRAKRVFLTDADQIFCLR